MVTKTALSPKDPDRKVRRQYWAGQLRALRGEFKTFFDGYAKHGYKNPQAYFAEVVYKEVVVVVKGILDEQGEPGEAPGMKKVRRDALDFLAGCHYYVQAMGQVYRYNLYPLRQRLKELSMSGWGYKHREYSQHFSDMWDLLAELQPPAEEAWVKGDIRDSPAFQATYQKFINLSLPEETVWDSERRFLISQSHHILRQAFESLNLPPELAEAPDELFDEKKRPTYVDVSFKSSDFQTGKGERPGLLSLKAKLGGTLGSEEEEAIREAALKRNASHDVGQEGPSKKAKVNFAYNMTLDNADADLEDLYSDAQFWRNIRRPEPGRLVTPTVGNREDTLRNYRDDLQEIITDCHKRYYRPHEDFKTQGQRDGADVRLRQGFEEMRPKVARSDNPCSSNMVLKRARLVAFRLKFMRALHIKLLLTSETPVAEDVWQQALKDRLGDWITYEERWNLADRKAFREQTRETYLDVINRRKASIARLTQLRADMDEEPSPNNRETGTVTGTETGTNTIKTDYGVFEFNSLRYALDKILDPPKPMRTVYVDEYTEKRHEAMRRANARARKEGTSVTAAMDAVQKRFEKTHSTMTAGGELGGPPDYEKWTCYTVWDKLSYMLVLTYWRSLHSGMVV